VTSRVEIQQLDAREREVQYGGRTILRGRSLASLLEELGGYEGEIALAGTNERVPISLEQWRGQDPEHTWLTIEIISDDPSAAPFRFVRGGASES
jgi:hypothetical protein